MNEVKDKMTLKSPFWSLRESTIFEKPSSHELAAYVFSGRLDHIPSRKSKVVKIFISSTFTDMYAERNYLIMTVFPRLQKYCKLNHNLEFQTVDMRWGVRDEAVKDHSGPKTCMDELNSCQESSLGPNFVCLLGQRYGSRPLQAEIVKTEFEAIVQALRTTTGEPEKDVDLDTLLDWYQCDSNGKPEIMVLSPLDDRNPPITPEAFRPVADILTTTLRCGAIKAVSNGKMSEMESMKFMWSVTEEEIYKGILSDEIADVGDHALCFHRVFNSINFNYPRVKRFVDMMPEEGDDKKLNEKDVEAERLMDSLVKRTKDRLPSENYHVETIDWAIRGEIDEDNLPNILKESTPEALRLCEYLKRFGDMFEEKVKALIEKAVNRNDPLRNHYYSNLLIEISEHDYQAINKIKTFQGRDDLMDQIETYIKSESNMPFVVHGKSGFGKTSLLAVASKKVYDWIGDTPELVVVRRFLGTTPDSTNIGSLLESVCSQITLAYRYRASYSNELMLRMRETFANLPKRARLVIFLDSLDQLSPFGNAYQLSWLPLFLPYNVKIVVSLIPPDYQQILLTTLQERPYPDSQFIEVNILETNLSLKLMSDWLTSYRRQLTEEQMDVIGRRFKEDQNTSPLYIKLIFDVVVKVRSYMDVVALGELLVSINTVVKCIHYINRQLMDKIGPLLVHRVFAYLHLSNLGLTENELVDLISMDDEVLNDVFQFSAPPIRRLPAAVWARIKNSIKEYIVVREANGGEVIAWYHRQFVEVGDEMYKDDYPPNYIPEELQTPQDLCQLLRENMVDYFMGKWADGKEKPFVYSEKLAAKKKLTDRNSKADRFLPSMPNVLENRQPNLRKMGQLPLLLIKLDRVNEFISEVFGNIEALVGLFHMYSWSDIYELIDSVKLDSYKAIGKDKNEAVEKSPIKDQFNILVESLKLTSVQARLCPEILGTLIQGRLMPFAAGSTLIQNFVNDIYEKGTKFNSFVCPHTQLEGVGGLLEFEIPNDHEGPCGEMVGLSSHGKDVLFTVSRKAIILDIESYEILMRYQPPDMLKNDRFELAAAADPFNDPEEVVACLKIHPKIYIFSLTKFNHRGTIDCRDVSGCETMRIHDLVVFREDAQSDAFVAVCGNANEGVLIYSASTENLMYRYVNNKPILVMCPVGEHDATFAIIQHDKATIVLYRDKEDLTPSVSPELPTSPTKQSQKSVSSPFQLCRQEKITLPGDSIITASHVTKGAFVIGTEDGHVYVGTVAMPEDNEKSVSAKRVLLPEPTHYVFTSLDKFEDHITVCTKNYAYLLTVERDMPAGLHKVEDSNEIFLNITAKIDIPLAKLYTIEELLIGFHLGQVYMLAFSKDDDEELASTYVVKKFDAHTRPLTGMIYHTASAIDGTVKVFDLERKVHRFSEESFSFDRMKENIRAISGSNTMSASLSSESTTVVIWSQKTGKIIGDLGHHLPLNDELNGVWCFSQCVATSSRRGLLSFWSVDDVSGEADLIHEFQIDDIHQIIYGDKNQNELIIRSGDTLYRYDVLSGEENGKVNYEDRDLLLHHYVNGQLSILQNMEQTGDYYVEVFDGNSPILVQLKGNGLPDHTLTSLTDVFCSENMLILLYNNQCVFYNWKKKQVVNNTPINKGCLVTNQSNSFIIMTSNQVTAYRINKGVEKLGSRDLQAKSDRIKITPDGRYVILVEGPKMIFMYRIEDLSVPIGKYSSYGDIDHFEFTHDSKYLMLAIADTRMFFLMLCDEKNPEHKSRVSSMIRREFSDEEKKRAEVMILNAGETGDIQDDIKDAKYSSGEINLLNYASPGEWLYLNIQQANLTRSVIQGRTTP